jgi:small-conductance mechanosensitive channel
MQRLTTRAIGSRADGMPFGPALAGSLSVPIRRLLLVGSLLLVAAAAVARGQGPTFQTEPARSQRPSAVTSGSMADSAEVDPAAVRAETLERLKEHDLTTRTDATTPIGSAHIVSPSASVSGASDNAGRAAAPLFSPSDPAAKKPLPALLQDRLRWLNEYDATSLALQKATHPEPSPQQQAGEAKAELRKLQSILKQAAEAPETLLPPLFRDRSVKVSSALGAEMKDAIEATGNEIRDWKSKLETLRSEIAGWNSLMNARRADRDTLFQRVTSLAAKNEEFKSAVTDAQTAALRRLAQERLTNYEWELRVESLRLRVIEAHLTLEAQLSEVRELRADVYRAHVQIATKTLEPMQARYRLVAEDQQRDLSRAKTDEENKARSSDDPLERFRARRTAELLALETHVIRSEQDLVISPPPSYEEQKTLADHADFDFANVKELLDDGKVSRLDAIRLNNEFRRIGPEHDRLLKNEMAAVESQLQFYENALTDVELELLQGSLHDRFEHDLLRERLPSSRWAEGEALVGNLERTHRSLLMRRQRALQKLCDRASHTLVQVTRRLGILDREYGFIRTNIFWVRDQESIGLMTLTQGAREFNVLVKGLLRLAKETIKPNLWAQPSVEFLITALAVLVFPIVLARLRRMLGALIKRDLPAPHTFMRGLRSLALGLVRAAIWPLYLVLLAYAARVAPWPRSLGILVSAVTTGAAIAILIHDLLHWVTSPSGWPEHYLGVPRAVARQLNTGGRFVVIAAVVFLLPVYLFDHELIAPEGKPITAPALGRLLVLGCELVVWGTCVRLLRGYSPFLGWLSLPLPSAPGPLPPVPTGSDQAGPAATQDGAPTTFSVSSRAYAGLVWLGRRRRLVTGLILASIAAVIALDVRGYSFTARRLALGGSQTTLAIAVAIAVYRAIAQAISQNAWRWASPNRSWAMALTSAMALRSKVRSRGVAAGPIAEVPAAARDLENDDDVPLADLAAGLGRLGAYAVTALTMLAIAWIWEVDMALLQFLLNKPLWAVDAQTSVTVGDLVIASVVILLGALAWRHMNALFAVTIFPRMPDDPGVRFAVVTLCRYAILGVACLIALGAIHVDLAKIGVVLAALGVGLGFGLQEVVSNFVCGIILLLERPIRIGDVVTVAGTTGKVDRINIRATTIVNSDNQSMIVPNREFITGNLVNWTLKDKILRVPIKMTVAYGTDPDRVVALLLRIARADADVMINPAPSASLEGFGESSLLFGLYTFVPEPGLSGDVKHRLCAEIQRRFTQEGIVIPYPTHELHLNNRMPLELTGAAETTPGDPLAAAFPYRYDLAAKTPPAPHAPAAGAQASAPLEAEQSKKA